MTCDAHQHTRPHRVRRRLAEAHALAGRCPVERNRWLRDAHGPNTQANDSKEPQPSVGPREHARTFSEFHQIDDRPSATHGRSGGMSRLPP